MGAASVCPPLVQSNMPLGSGSGEGLPRLGFSANNGALCPWRRPWSLPGLYERTKKETVICRLVQIVSMLRRQNLETPSLQQPHWPLGNNPRPAVRGSSDPGPWGLLLTPPDEGLSSCTSSRDCWLLTAPGPRTKARAQPAPGCPWLQESGAGRRGPAPPALPRPGSWTASRLHEAQATRCPASPKAPSCFHLDPD